MTTIIYETKGRAREYCELAANLYRGCGHGCTYCYAPLAIRTSRDDFCQPRVRDGVMYKFEKDAIELRDKGETRPILLSFTTDPYQPLDVETQLTRKAIKILHQNKLKVSILTKGGRRSERDFDLLSEHPELSEYGTTLVFTDEAWREKIEPRAAPTVERIESLKKAYGLGIFTYVSLEPVWFPEQTLQLIDLTHEFVDLFKVGKLNYNKQQHKVDWKAFKAGVIRKLNEYNSKYYIKDDLKKY
ncbi:SPL family radical SAM protein [Methanoculleus sediminis]